MPKEQPAESSWSSRGWGVVSSMLWDWSRDERQPPPTPDGSQAGMKRVGSAVWDWGGGNDVSGHEKNNVQTHIEEAKLRIERERLRRTQVQRRPRQGAPAPRPRCPAGALTHSSPLPRARRCSSPRRSPLSSASPPTGSTSDRPPRPPSRVRSPARPSTWATEAGRDARARDALRLTETRESEVLHLMFLGLTRAANDAGCVCTCVS